tara:strand:+ start:154 stop:282 length:129 start_codon:yes stop_codon:yes gene_type:complete
MDVPKDLIQPWKVTIQEEHSLAICPQIGLPRHIDVENQAQAN